MPGPHEIYLIRHAIAEERSDAWPDDAKRPLTEDGISRMRKAARGAVRMGVSFDVILASPLVRTRQTAEVVAAAFDDLLTQEHARIEECAAGDHHGAARHHAAARFDTCNSPLFDHQPKCFGGNDLDAALAEAKSSSR